MLVCQSLAAYSVRAFSILFGSIRRAERVAFLCYTYHLRGTLFTYSFIVFAVEFN